MIIMANLTFILTFLVLFSVTEIFGMTKVQLKKTLALPKKTCMKKNDVTEDQVGDIEKGHFIEDPKVMCYIACIYTMMSLVKSNKLNYELSIRQVENMYPDDHKDNGKASIDHCVPTTKSYKDDLCKQSYYTAKCMYEYNPKLFIFA